MSEMTCIRVGYGHVAQIHEIKMQELNVRTVAVVEVDEKKVLRAQQNGYQVFHSCYEAAKKITPSFWDICVSTNQHFNIIQEIIKIDLQANILVEKPVCLFSQISELRKSLLNFQGKITVNENYASSSITDIIRKIAFQDLDIQSNKLIIEFTKNRGTDFIKGRFIDQELGVLGYEGSHILTLASSILREDLPEKVLETQFSDYVFEDSQRYLDKQGSAYIRCQSNSGVDIELYTAMTGKIKYSYPLFCIDDIPMEDQKTKYRIIALDGNDIDNNKYSILGFLEPIECFNRCYGAVYIIKNNKIEKIIAPISDNTMLTHFQKTLKYFQNNGRNPYSVEQGITCVETLNYLASNSTARQPVQ